MREMTIFGKVFTAVVLINLLFTILILGSLAVKGIASLSVALNVTCLILVSGCLGINITNGKILKNVENNKHEVLFHKSNRSVYVVFVAIGAMLIIVPVAYIISIMFSGVFGFFKGLSLLGSIIMALIVPCVFTRDPDEAEYTEVEDTDTEEDIIDA